MAKLEGVKIIDMQDGEITKIEYEGEEYTKVENVTEPVDGDIALNKVGTSSYTEGAFYELREGLTNYGSFGTKTDDQGSKNNGKSRDHFDVFRKVSAPTLTDRVDDLETRVSALEAEQTEETPKGFDKPAEKTSIKVGDHAKVVGKTYSNDITEGTIVEVTQEADFEGDYRIDLIDGSEYDFAKPEALEKIELSEADLVFIKNGREPGEYKDGDIIRVIDARSSLLNEGDIGEVSEEGDVFRVNTAKVDYGNYRNADKVEPIVFVEQRVDKVA